MRKIPLALLSGFVAIPFIMYACGGGGDNCFPAGTKIQTPNGDVSVENIKVGDSVIAYDLIEKKAVTARVVQTYVHEHDLVLKHVILKGGKVLLVTPEHPLYSLKANGWVKAGSLAAGDQLLMRDAKGGTIEGEIESLTTEKSSANVYNLETGKPGNYFVEGILAKYY